MLVNTAKRSLRLSATRALAARCMSSDVQPKVTVIGAAGGIGQPLSLLMKLQQTTELRELALYDLAPFTPGVAVDLSHINSPSKVTGWVGGDQLGDALKDADVVVVPAGLPRKPGMSRDDLFTANAGIAAALGDQIAESCPNARLLIITNPVNSTVPILAEVLKQHGCFDPKKLMGVTTLDVVRARTFVAENLNQHVNQINVPVIGGHAGTTILPLLSQVSGTFSDADRDALTHRIMFGGDEVVQAKAGAGSATLSMAWAGAYFAQRVLAAMRGEKGIIECSYVQSEITDAPFFSSPVELGVDGVEKVHGFGPISDYEQKLLDDMLPDLKAQIQKGVDFAKNRKA